MPSKFEKIVIEQLKKIPKGKITTYGLLAKAVGRPKAVRAVGNAVGKNPFAPEVPCHRVVRSNGILGGYSGGLKKKIALLRKEKIKIWRGKVVDFDKRTYTF